MTDLTTRSVEKAGRQQVKRKIVVNGDKLKREANGFVERKLILMGYFFMWIRGAEMLMDETSGLGDLCVVYIKSQEATLLLKSDSVFKRTTRAYLWVNTARRALGRQFKVE